MRVLALCAAVALAACTGAPTAVVPTASPTREPNVVNVTALLDLSGPRAPSGQPQRDAMQIWLDQNASTGALRMRVKFVDVAGSDAKLLLELRRAAVEDRADAVVVGVPVSLEGSFGDAAQVAAMPIVLTTPGREPAATAAGRAIFTLAPTPEMLA
ncbi:MAG TPA: hypothetical protein VJQ09_08565, partial [Candidatus Limnocylindria bacterium]|nr:hypothetical protein [Candidatus Limnocylindria bacterium]